MLQQGSVSSEADPFVVMWSRDGDLDNRPGSVFQPNHFCFLEICSSCKRKASPLDNGRNKMTRTGPHSKKKQGTILSFFTKQPQRARGTEGSGEGGHMNDSGEERVRGTEGSGSHER